MGLQGMLSPKGGEGGVALGLSLNSACLKRCMLQTPARLQLQVQTARKIKTGFRDVGRT